MPDLIDDFFKRDLSENEMNALERLLEDQVQALRMLKIADRRYRSTGLPEPDAKSFWRRLRFRPNFILWARTAGVLLVGSLGIVVWQWQQTVPMSVPVPTISKPAVSLVVKDKNQESRPLAAKIIAQAPSARRPLANHSRKKSRSQLAMAFQSQGEINPPMTTPPLSSASPESPAMAMSMAPPPAAAPAALPMMAKVAPRQPANPIPAGAPMATDEAKVVLSPANAQELTASASPDLSIAVTVDRPVHLLIQVVSEENQELRIISDQDFAVGRWPFSWDGTNDTGVPMPKGHYYFQVKGPSTQWFSIEIK